MHNVNVNADETEKSTKNNKKTIDQRKKSICLRMIPKTRKDKVLVAIDHAWELVYAPTPRTSAWSRIITGK